MQNCGEQLNYNWDHSCILGGEELFGRVKLTHGPDAWNHDANVVACDFWYNWVLVNSNKNLLRKSENHDDWNHDHCAHESTSVVEHTAVDPHPFFVAIWVGIVLTCSEALADKCLKSSIEALDHRKSEDVDKHIAHSNSSN